MRSLAENVRNVVSLGLSYGVIALLPLILYPVLISSTSEQDFGIFISKVSFYTLAFLFFEYSFSLTATKQIARNTIAHEECFSQVYSFKNLAFIFSAVLVLLFSSEVFDLLFLLFHFSESLIPRFFYQAELRNREAAIAQVITKTSVVIFVFLAKDQENILMLYLAFSIVMNFLCAVILIFKSRVSFNPLSMTSAITALIGGYNVFLSNLSVGAYTALLPYFVSLHATAPTVTNFVLVERVVNLIKSIPLLLVQVLYPQIVNEEVDFHLLRVRQAMAICFSASLAGVFVVCVSVFFLVDLTKFGLLSLMVVVPLLTSLSNVLGHIYLVGLRSASRFREVITAASLMGVLVINLFGTFFSEVGVVFGLLFTEFLIVIVFLREYTNESFRGRSNL